VHFISLKLALSLYSTSAPNYGVLSARGSAKFLTGFAIQRLVLETNGGAKPVQESTTTKGQYNLS